MTICRYNKNTKQTPELMIKAKVPSTDFFEKAKILVLPNLEPTKAAYGLELVRYHGVSHAQEDDSAELDQLDQQHGLCSQNRVMLDKIKP